MAEGLPGALGQDWRAGLAAGRLRDARCPPGGGRWLGGWALVCLLVGLTLYSTSGYQGGFALLNSSAAGLPDRLWQGLTMLGDERLAFALGLVLARRRPQIFWSLVAAALVAAAFTHGLKPLFGTLRPPAVLAADEIRLIGPGYRYQSFPSGHSVTAAVFFGVLVCFASGWGWRLLWVLLAVAAGLSRVAVGVHWPVDVAAGLFGGALASWCGVWLARRFAWGVQDVSVHLALVTLAGIMAMSLLLWDGGYTEVAQLQRLVGLMAMGYAFTVYLVLPIGRWGYRFWRSQPG